MDRKTQQTVITVIVLLIALVAYIAKQREQDPPAPPPAIGDRSHLTMGNPSNATADESNRDNFLMKKPYFALSYNNTLGTPNWVSWSLMNGDFGTAKRADQFVPDGELPRSFKHVTTNDYTRSGFDRGHMCPHSDRASTAEASEATFVMTNIIPQSPNCNQHAWNDLEEYCRGLVKQKHKTLYIVAGPNGKGGEGKEGRAQTLHNGKVTVPASSWKVVMALDNGTGTEADIALVNPSTRLIAVVMPNDQSVGFGWAKYRTSVRDVETLTGFKFFDRVPAGIIDPLKAKVDDETIPPVGRPRTGD